MAFSIRGLSLLFLVGCAAPQTQLAPVPKEAVKAEEEKQRELALEENRQQQQRLDSLGFPILSRGLPLCTHDSGARLSARFATVYQYDPSWRPAAAKLLGVGDTLTVVGITPGGAAYNGGLREGDRILAVEGQPVQPGPGAVKDFSTKVADARKSNRSRISLAVLSLGGTGAARARAGQGL
jgi:membrane-associated protease RseP (regulator of RpoE activity)